MKLHIWSVMCLCCVYIMIMCLSFRIWDGGKLLFCFVVWLFFMLLFKSKSPTYKTNSRGRDRRDKSLEISTILALNYFIWKVHAVTLVRDMIFHTVIICIWTLYLCHSCDNSCIFGHIERSEKITCCIYSACVHWSCLSLLQSWMLTKYI